LVCSNTDEGTFPRDWVFGIEMAMPKGVWAPAIQTAASKTHLRGAFRIDGHFTGARCAH